MMVLIIPKVIAIAASGASSQLAFEYILMERRGTIQTKLDPCTSLLELIANITYS